MHILNHDERISPRDYAIQRSDSSRQLTLIDTRPPTEFDICHLPEAKSEDRFSPFTTRMLHISDITLEQLKSLDRSEILSRLDKEDVDDNSSRLTDIFQHPFVVFVVCHRGNDSQLGVRILQEKLAASGFRFRDIIGGLDRWALDVDEDFPRY